jgi:hypothetical protein
MPRLDLYAFRYRDPLSGKWMKARYRAERHVIAARYAEWETIGPAEIRLTPEAFENSFRPWRWARPPGSIQVRRGGLSLRVAGVSN